MDVDQTLLQLGRFGRFQMRTYLLTTIIHMHLSMHILVLTFQGLQPQHQCATPNQPSYVTNQAQLNQTIPWEWDQGAQEWQRSKCQRFDNEAEEHNATRAVKIDCDQGWRFYNPDRGKVTIVEEWSLVCDSKSLTSVAQSTLMAGEMVGALFIAQLTDMFGRKPLLLSALWLQGIVDIVLSFMPSYIPFVCLVFFVGLLGPGYGLAAFVLGCEYLSVDMRVYSAVFAGMMWMLGMLLLDALAFIMPSWRYLQISLAICNFLTIPYIWLLPESLHWLVTHGKEAEAKMLVRKAAKMNGLENVPNLVVQTEMECLSIENGVANVDTKQPLQADTFLPVGVEEEQRNSTGNVEEKELPTKYTILSILCHPLLLPRSTILCLIWFSNSVVYYGLSLYTPSLPGDVYINFMISALVEFPAYLIAMVVLKRFGRRKSLMGFYVVAGVSLFVIMFIPKTTDSGTDLSHVITGLCMIGKFGISGSFNTLYLYGAEVYPTVVRNIGIGWNSVWARVGGILSPFVKDLHGISPYLVPIIFGVLALLCAMLMLCLPETSHSPLPETMTDVPKFTVKELVCGGGERKNVKALHEEECPQANGSMKN